MSLKEWKEYRKNKKIVKRELVKIGSNTLPVVGVLTDKGSDIFNTIVALFESCKGKTGDELREEFIGKLAEVIHSENNSEQNTELSEKE